MSQFMSIDSCQVSLSALTLWLAQNLYLYLSCIYKVLQCQLMNFLFPSSTIGLAGFWDDATSNEVPANRCVNLLGVDG